MCVWSLSGCSATTLFCCMAKKCEELLFLSLVLSDSAMEFSTSSGSVEGESKAGCREYSIQWRQTEEQVSFSIYVSFNFGHALFHKCPEASISFLWNSRLSRQLWKLDMCCMVQWEAERNLTSSFLLPIFKEKQSSRNVDFSPSFTSCTCSNVGLYSSYRC